MSFARRNPKPRPAQEPGLRFPKTFRYDRDEQIDTRGLVLRKIHPDRDEAYRKWLRLQPCAVKGLVDGQTGQLHVCWSPNLGPRNAPLSDPAHSGKSYSGALKRNDSECIALCRHAHRMQEDNMDAFDRRYGINRFEIAARLRAEFLKDGEVTRMK